jgi:cytidine deaminase
MSDLIEAACEARKMAYAPYSNYNVGAAVRGVDGRIWSGCNVENVSYPLSVCAERNAVAQMVRDGCKDILEVAVVTKDGGTPCGGCLQVLLEFSPNPASVRVHAVSELSAGGGGGIKDERQVTSYSLLELIPHGFRSNAVPRTER